MENKKSLTSDTASDTITNPKDQATYHVHLYAPENLDGADQQLAYQEFISTLTEILVKYAADII